MMERYRVWYVVDGKEHYFDVEAKDVYKAWEMAKEKVAKLLGFKPKELYVYQIKA